MFDNNQIKNKNDVQEILHAINEKFGTVLETELQDRLRVEAKQSARNALDDLIRQMEQHSHINLAYHSGGTPDEIIKQRGEAALMVKDLITQLDEFAKGLRASGGASRFSKDFIAAVYYGHQIFAAVDSERSRLFQFLPVAPAAAVQAPAPAPYEEVVISSRSEK